MIRVVPRAPSTRGERSQFTSPNASPGVEGNFVPGQRQQIL